jgi:hypothetical protein
VVDGPAPRRKRRPRRARPSDRNGIDPAIVDDAGMGCTCLVPDTPPKSLSVTGSSSTTITGHTQPWATSPSPLRCYLRPLNRLPHDLDQPDGVSPARERRFHRGTRPDAVAPFQGSGWRASRRYGPGCQPWSMTHTSRRGRSSLALDRLRRLVVSRWSCSAPAVVPPSSWSLLRLLLHVQPERTPVTTPSTFVGFLPAHITAVTR